jgi:hypothetical protein
MGDIPFGGGDPEAQEFNRNPAKRENRISL